MLWIILLASSLLICWCWTSLLSMAFML